MALVLADRVKQTSTSTGTGAFTLSATPTGFRAFSAVLATSDTTYYCIAHQSANEWEVGYGTYSSANTLTRTTVISSSNSGAAVTFSAGTKDVFITQPAIGTQASNLVLGSTVTYNQGSYSDSVLVGVLVNGGTGNNVVVGKGATASTNYSVVVGRNANAGSNGDVALGAGASCTQSDSVAIGVNCTASGTNGHTIGSNSTAGAYSVAIGSSASAYVNSSVAVGVYSYASYENSVVVGYGTGSSSSGPETRVGANQSTGAGSSNVLVGRGINTATNSPSSSIAIGENIVVGMSNATYMNQFRLDPTTGLVGPAYTLTYDSTTNEVYAVTGGPAPGGADWYVFETSGFTGQITAPTNYVSMPSGPAYAGLGGAISSPFSIGWSPVMESWSFGNAYYNSGMNWSMYPSPITYTSPPPSSGTVYMYVQYPSGHGLISYSDVWGSITSWNSSYGPNLMLSSFPSSGTTQKMYGITLVESMGTDITSVISPNPSYPSLTYETAYSSFSGTTIVFWSITNTSEVSSLSMGGVPFAWGPSSYNYYGHVWYEWS